MDAQKKSDCTEPDRANCPRMCQDFCNEAASAVQTDEAIAMLESIVEDFKYREADVPLQHRISTRIGKVIRAISRDAARSATGRG